MRKFLLAVFAYGASSSDKPPNHRRLTEATPNQQSHDSNTSVVQPTHPDGEFTFDELQDLPTWHEIVSMPDVHFYFILQIKNYIEYSKKKVKTYNFQNCMVL